MVGNKRIGSKFDDFLAQDGTLAEVEAVAIKRVLAWQIEHAMKEDRITKAEMAERMGTSRSSLDRFLNPAITSVTLHTMGQAAAALGKILHIELLDAPMGLTAHI
ncbi:MAG: XRE family transcriptional regulator [Deltaproteobacteria bacterium]|nr:XRE family transcriptional regulator [Deltaproteobacteria bacterium]